MQQKTFLVIIIALILALGAGVFIGSSMTKKLPQGVSSTTENTYQSGWDDAMKTIRDSGVLPAVEENVQMNVLSAEITAISGNTLTVKVTDPTLLMSAGLQTRTITFNNETKIKKLVPRDAERVAKEQAEFDEKMKNFTASNNEAMPLPPVFLDEQVVSAADLQVGLQVSVTSSGDIRNSKSIEATDIHIETASNEGNANSINPGDILEVPAPKVTESADMNTAPPVPTSTGEQVESADSIDMSKAPALPGDKK